MRDRAVAIVSGGLDSTTLAYFLRDQGYDLHILSFDYGQKHAKELVFAAETALALHSQFNVIDLQSLAPLISNSALTSDREVPEGHYSEESMKQTVVPNRNSIMLAIAWGVAVSDGAPLVTYAAHTGDHAIYPDCRPEFVDAFTHAEELANQGFGETTLWAPFIHKSKAGIVEIGEKAGVPWRKTWSCYQGGAVHCGRCGTCVERQEAFHLARVLDPTDYEDSEYWKSAIAQGA
jgi:7-cyano-7-deazaguanine synthase